MKRRGFLQALMLGTGVKAQAEPPKMLVKVTNLPGVITPEQISSVTVGQIQGGYFVLRDYQGRHLGKLPVF